MNTSIHRCKKYITVVRFSRIATLVAACVYPLLVSAAPLKVYILAGQSNMQGHASVSTFDYLAKDPATAPVLAEMRDKEGRPTVCKHQGFHYHGAAKFYGPAGKAFAEAIIEMKR